MGIEAPAIRELPAFRRTYSDKRRVAEWGRGFIDLLGGDAQGAIRVVETKLGADDMLVLQGLDYYVWADRFRDELAGKLGIDQRAPLTLHFVVGRKDTERVVAIRTAARRRPSLPRSAGSSMWSPTTGSLSMAGICRSSTLSRRPCPSKKAEALRPIRAPRVDVTLLRPPTTRRRRVTRRS